MRGPQELGDDFRVEGGAPRCNSREGFDEVAHVGNAIFQEVSDARRTAGQQL